RALVPKWWAAQSRQSVAQASFADRHRSILRITWSRESHEPSTFSNQGNRHRLLKVLLGPTHSSLRAEFYPRALFCRPLTRLSHSKKCIGAPNQRKFFCDKDFPQIRGRPDANRL